MTLPNEPMSPRRGGINRPRQPPTILPAALRSSGQPIDMSKPLPPLPPTSAREYSLRLGHCEQAQRTAAGFQGALYPRMKPCETCACIFETNDLGVDGTAEIVDDLCKGCRKTARLDELHQILNNRPLSRCLDFGGEEEEEEKEEKDEEKRSSAEKRAQR
ncbi:MAG: hypothetical protein M1812_007606 [Candelaria pacifica]|nr:MAG: hypothetical protein M1812_007606 [Candelaria pacifica]